MACQSSTMDKSYISNPVLNKLPQHLRQYILPQNYERYTPEDQAVWRYVMKKNANFLPKVAHESYLHGLDKTGIDLNSIPSMYGMNRILKNIGWAAVSVNGLIPSAAFMEFQAYNVLVIASDIRMLKNIEYTPTPDIIHESAGHSPMIAIPEYAEYLRRFGELGAKAISSDLDRQLFEAVRKLAALKENPNSDQQEINKIESEIVDLQESMTRPSELQLIKNLHWWTIEYGLLGDIDNPKIYGAGLLSSIGESEWCLSDKVQKIPFSIEAAYQSFDVTKPQPQLFVTPNFAFLSQVLDQFANTMAVRKGGKEGVLKLIDSKQLGTIELSTGLQITGVFTELIESEDKKPVYVQTSGPTALSYREKELIGQSTDHHPYGFGTAIGKLKGINLAIEDMSPRDLQAYRIIEGEEIQLEFEGGIKVSGMVITGTRNLHGKIMLVAFENCTVAHYDRIIFHPNRGIYHLAIGLNIISAFAGPADLTSFDLTDHSMVDVYYGSTVDISSPKQKYFQQIRHLRNESFDLSVFMSVCSEILNNFPNEWLLLLEAYELAHLNAAPNKLALLENLHAIQKRIPQKAHLIDDGLSLINLEEQAI
jgi:phenylalanine-4-hydroxylase